MCIPADYHGLCNIETADKVAKAIVAYSADYLPAFDVAPVDHLSETKSSSVEKPSSQ